MSWNPEPGIYFDISWEQYCRCSYMSPSLLKHGQRSMKRLRRAIDGECKPSAKTTAVGNAVHCMLAGEFEDRNAVMPAFELDAENQTATGKKSTAKTTAYYKESKLAWEQENEGKTFLTEVEVAVARKVVRNILGKPECQKVVAETHSEVTIIAQLGGVMCKTRLDHLSPSERMIADTKTTSDVQPQAFYRLAKRLGYFFSAGFHCLAVSEAPGGFEPQLYKFVAAEISDDYDVGLVNVPFALIDQYKSRVLSTLEKYRLSLSSDDWPGLYPMEGQLCVPEYDMADEDELHDFDAEIVSV